MTDKEIWLYIAKAFEDYDAGINLCEIAELGLCSAVGYTPRYFALKRGQYDRIWDQLKEYLINHGFTLSQYINGNAEDKLLRARIAREIAEKL